MNERQRKQRQHEDYWGRCWRVRATKLVWRCSSGFRDRSHPGTATDVTDIANVETGASREDILFSDETPVGLYDNGQFFGHSGHDGLDLAPIYLDGFCYGPDHAEAAGVFGYNKLIGAFGAKQQ